MIWQTTDRPFSQVLTDPEKRAQFDQGVDPLDPEAQRAGGHDGPFHAPFHHFQYGSPFQFKFHFNQRPRPSWRAAVSSTVILLCSSVSLYFCTTEVLKTLPRNFLLWMSTLARRRRLCLDLSPTPEDHEIETLVWPGCTAACICKQTRCSSTKTCAGLFVKY